MQKRSESRILRGIKRTIYIYQFNNIAIFKLSFHKIIKDNLVIPVLRMRMSDNPLH